MKPVLFAQEYGFASLPAVPDGLVPLATFAEAEGLSIIAETLALAAVGVAHQGGHARISLDLESALDGVGLTAAIAAALAGAGIACNVVAAFHHDHLFVPWERREEALALIASLENPL
nr:ACT domain-containing protein [Sphingomicrobium nitratireducens]